MFVWYLFQLRPTFSLEVGYILGYLAKELNFQAATEKSVPRVKPGDCTGHELGSPRQSISKFVGQMFTAENSVARRSLSLLGVRSEW